MQPLRLGRWGSSILPLSRRHCSPASRSCHPHSVRFQSTVQLQSSSEQLQTKPKRGRPRKGEQSPRALRAQEAIPSSTAQGGPSISSSLGESGVSETQSTPPNISASLNDNSPPSRPNYSPDRQTSTLRPNSHTEDRIPRDKLSSLPSPPPYRASKSAKLAALHARLSLPSRIPLETLARCLVDKSADSDPRFNNHSLSVLGNDLLGYYISEHLICYYPRLPMVVLDAAIYAYIGPKALQSVTRGWGVETAAEPGGEVDSGLLQLRQTLPTRLRKDIAVGMQRFAEEQTGTSFPRLVEHEHASAAFVRAVVGSVYMHSGAEKVQEFFKAHILSRKLDLHSLFTFTQPTRDLSRLCARESFERPVARLVSETGRASRHPVFVVGVFSGRDKLGEDAGASLDEARFKAAAKALKGWYLYSPKNALGDSNIMLPSMMEGEKGKGLTWRKPHIDDGEVIV